MSSTVIAALERGFQVFDVGPCAAGYELGFAIGRNFASMIQSRVAGDTILQEQLLPFSITTEAMPLLDALGDANRVRYPVYWDEMAGMADGSAVPLSHLMLLNFRKEILPFITMKGAGNKEVAVAEDDCSDIIVVSDTLAIVAHNEDANVTLAGHTYIVKAVLKDGLSFTAFTYAGELPSCAYGFNSNGVAFTLDSVPPVKEEVAAGEIGRNFISRDLLEARDLQDAIKRVCLSNVSVGHSYNLMCTRTRRILNVETASRGRYSVHEAQHMPFFHANMYKHLLTVQQAIDGNSIRRDKRAGDLPLDSKEKALSALGDVDDSMYPIFMTGPVLYTLCTALIDLDEATLTIYRGNPTNRVITHTFQIPR